MKNSSQQTRDNHYVPVWYQRRFMAANVNGLFYLDLDAARSADPIKRKIVERAGRPLPPKRCFVERDLYTTVFAGVANDDIERRLFGRIDNDGAIATHAFAANDLAMVTEQFQAFFEYMSAQKLRTPKGLDWLKANYPKLSQAELMLELQILRRMYCTMWFECVREVVSAEDSSVKFVISDHPVVTFNRAVPLDAPEATYPNDPPIDWKGTQTLVPLDSNHCLILTHLEYAKHPRLADLTAKRTHARYFGEALARTDNTIYGRKMSEEDVRQINRLIAARAKRYLAAAQREWLQDAIVLPPDLQHLAGLLRPPHDELFRYGGTTYVGFTDGRSRSWDEFGRTEPERAFLKKRPPEREPAATDACPCGNGHVFGECCQGRDPRDRPPWDLWSLRERNLRFIDAVLHVLGLTEGKTWLDVRRELSAEQVKTIHELFEGLWPPDLDFSALLPRPDTRRLRALSFGVADPRLIATNVVGWLPYFDEIVVLNPFVNARYLQAEYSPITSPDQHKVQTLKNVMLLLILRPFIQEGWVHLVPDPTELNPAIRQMVHEFGRMNHRVHTASQLPDRELELLGRNDFERSILQCSDHTLRTLIAQSSPHLGPDKIEKALEFMKRKREDDPFALLQDPLDKQRNLMLMRGVSISTGLFLASLTGSLPYTDLNLWWNNLKAFAVDANASDAPTTEAIAQALRSARIVLEPHPEHAMRLRGMSAFVNYRAAWRDAWNILCEGSGDQATIEAIAARIRESTQQVHATAVTLSSNQCSPVRIERTLDCLLPPDGLALREAHRMLVAFGHGRHLPRIPMALFGHQPSQVGTKANSVFAR
jgi:hypothetical protein